MPESRIAVADDNPIIREGFRSKLIGLGFSQIILPDYGSALTSLTGLADVLLCSHSFFQKVKTEEADHLKEAGIEKFLVLLSSVHEFDPGVNCPAGSEGWLLHDAPSEEWRFALHCLNAGRGYVAPEIAVRISVSLRNLAPAMKHPDGLRLSPREKEVLQLVADGYTNDQIAKKIFASKRTVETHRMRLIDKTKTRNTATLIKFAVRAGLVK